MPNPFNLRAYLTPNGASPLSPRWKVPPSHPHLEQNAVMDYREPDFRLPPNDARMRSTGAGAGAMNMSQMISEMLKAVKRQSDFLPITQTILANMPGQLVLASGARTYFIVQNNDTVATLFLGIGFSPTSTFGLQIPPGGNYEPIQVPQGDIFLNASASCQITILYAADITPDAGFSFSLT